MRVTAIDLPAVGGVWERIDPATADLAEPRRTGADQQQRDAEEAAEATFRAWSGTPAPERPDDLELSQPQETAVEGRSAASLRPTATRRVQRND